MYDSMTPKMSGDAVVFVLSNYLSVGVCESHIRLSTRPQAAAFVVET